MTDRDALFQAVLANPADDLPRLVLADWLDEHDEPDYAAFIRLQCELAEAERRRVELLNDETPWDECTCLSARWCPNCGDCSCRDPETSLSDDACPLHSPHSPHRFADELDERIDALQERERALWLGDGPPRWFADLPGAYRTTVASTLTIETANGLTYTVRRGFVSAVRCRLADWLGGVCENCAGFGEFRRRHDNGDGPEGPCPDCGGKWNSGPHDDPDDYWDRGTGRTPGVGPAVVACQPVERVEVTDREPADRTSVNGLWYWFRVGQNALGHYDDANHLPDDVFDRLDGAAADTIGLPYPTRNAALAALSAALIAWAGKNPIIGQEARS